MVFEVRRRHTLEDTPVVVVVVVVVVAVAVDRTSAEGTLAVHSPPGRKRCWGRRPDS